MDKIIEDLRIKDLIKICKNGCDNCTKKLVKVCKQTGYMLCMLSNADKTDLQSIISIEKDKSE